MGLSLYLAMTATEIAACEALPPNLAYMACHFSPYSTGLSNFPDSLPENALLILNDRTPACGHDPKLIANQLQQLIEDFSCCGVLLDLQRPDNPETAQIAAAVVSALPGLTAVSDLYAKNLNCPVFLPPPPLRLSLFKYLEPWQDREIWLEAAPDAETITVTAQGSQSTPLPLFCVSENCFIDEALYCRYETQILPEQISFHIERSGRQLEDMLTQAHALGVARAVGLYQLLHD